ncbi:glycosyltransferase family 17 protein [Phlebiopsis gigantea 11061_1 CR5-6]|uniref:Glycosyltransferase family 17 protein n=1 Tax=Phlebiopsis gigantea (strain 11061_1 CR5-6) TaxID=745531 RepID=A0A0C3PJX9_PHLG1|nr:glycosyltransferase family 17 protein [Phlebiopsis gigantea 11061_1 CR5-6]
MHVRQRFATILALVLTLSGLVFLLKHQLQVRNFLSYSTRPLWDTPNGPKNTISHYYAEGVSFDQHLCQLHGWDVRPGEDVPEVWDAILMSTELDLLEIRMHELKDVVSKFFIVESDRTFTGIPKTLTFAEYRNRFAEFEDKIVYSLFHGRELLSGESPFENEIAQRRHMDALLRSYVSPSARAPMIIFSDVDEIPYAHTMSLLQHCTAPSPIHLQMKEYLYSFEWPAGEGSWRAQVHRFTAGDDAIGYGHSQATEVKLADAGWHCSFCFRTIDEFIAKMQGYSHADRVTDPSLLKPERIQQVVCSGDDIFGMLPEAYRWKDLFSLLHKDATPSAVHLPAYLIQQSDRFKFLLPGGCTRET